MTSRAARGRCDVTMHCFGDVVKKEAVRSLNNSILNSLCTSYVSIELVDIMDIFIHISYVPNNRVQGHLSNL